MTADHSLLTGVLDEPSLARFYDRANGARWGLPRDAFSRALARSVASRFGASGANVSEIEDYLESLHLEDLALACACAVGQVSAWAYFLECFRPGLRTAACVIAGPGEGAELADGLYAELYGLDERDGHRRALFDYYHGRSRLATWLRAVLAQRHVDRLRQTRRLQPLGDGDGDEAGPPVDAVAAVRDPERARYAVLAQAALARAIAQLEPRDRLRLDCYYLQRLTLAQIGRMFGEHEATVSRKLDRLRRDLRDRVERILRDDHQLSSDQVSACFECALDDTAVNLERAFRGAGPRQETAG